MPRFVACRGPMFRRSYVTVDWKPADGQRAVVAAPVPLIPNDCASAVEGTQSFSTVFQKRYCKSGQPVPPFFIGSLQEAISEAFDKQPIIADRRSLVLYIHHDGYATTNFQQRLCVDTTVELLRSHFVLWPWDVTAKENRVKLMTWLAECSLYDAISDVASALARSESGGFSLLLMLIKNGGEVKSERKIETHQADKIYATLIRVMDRHEEWTRGIGTTRPRRSKVMKVEENKVEENKVVENKVEEK